MGRVIQILFGAGFTVALAAALGSLALRGLRVRLDQMESALMSFVAGSAVLSLATYGLCIVGQARAAVFLGAGVPLIACAIWLRWKGRREKVARLDRGPMVWRGLFYGGMALFAFIYFVTALAPEVSPDGSGYHLGNVLRMIERHGFAWGYHSIYAHFPQGMEMLFLVSATLGGYSSAALVHLAFLLALPLLMASFGERYEFPRAAMAAGLLVFASPVVGIDGASAYNDVALATVSVAVIYCIHLLDDGSSGRFLLTIGFLAGFCFAIKYTGALALLLALWWIPRGRRWLWVLAGAVLSAGPWIARNWLWLGNPFAPFLNRWFPNPYYYPGPEQSYLADLRHYENFRHWWQVPVDLALHGGSITGIVGPVFLLTPLAFLALRNRYGRRMLLAAAVWTIPACFNSGARFLIPALPFLAMALGIALENSWGALPALAAFQLWACWPSTLAAYAAPWSWRTREVPVQAALGRESEAAFLASRLPDYVFKAAIDREVKPSEKIFSYAGRPEAYLDRSIVVGYESALGLLVQDILAQAATQEEKVRRRWQLDGRPVIGLRLVSRQASPDYWKVSDIRMWDRDGEVRLEASDISASPNPWQAWLAFDGSPVTRWSTWQPLQRGFSIDAGFREDVAITRVTVEAAAAPDAHPQLQVATLPRQWRPVSDAAAEDVAVPPRDLREEAMRQLKARGIFYLLINDSDPPAEDLKENPNLWGVTVIQEAHGSRFYRIQ